MSFAVEYLVKLWGIHTYIVSGGVSHLTQSAHSNCKAQRTPAKYIMLLYNVRIYLQLHLSSYALVPLTRSNLGM